MSQQLSTWDMLPAGFLKKTHSGWLRLDFEVRRLVMDLAKEQHFKCALCSANRNLEIDHDREPFRGVGTRLTVDNIRGILCGWCNKQLSLYQREQRGEFSGLENVYCLLHDREAELYLETYDRRVRQLEKDRLERACPNYWTRWNFLYRFDQWRYEGEKNYPWPWHFEEIKDRRHGKVRTPGQFLRGLAAIVKFLADKREKDPDYELPESFVRLTVMVKPIFDEVRPIIQARMAEMASKTD